MSNLDRYGNKIDLRLNAGEMFENHAIAALDSKVFRYHVKTKAGTVPLKAVINQLRGIAKYLEKQQLVSNVTFSLQVDEVTRKEAGSTESRL